MDVGEQMAKLMALVPEHRLRPKSKRASESAELDDVHAVFMFNTHP